MPSRLLQSWNSAREIRRYRTGVSLHSHTLHSRESIIFLARHARRLAVAGCLFRHWEQRYAGDQDPDAGYERIWWTPPLPATSAYRLEAAQVESLDLLPIVSLTDHDSIDACLALRLAGIEAPVSVEWTVPFGPSFLHLGVHNLPGDETGNWMKLFRFWTARPNPHILRDILAGLHAMPGVLTVCNHPLWDEGGIGPDGQRDLLRTFLAGYRPFLHALEWNGLRPRTENQLVARISEEMGIPLLSGGDRHGCEPSAAINLTNAGCFAEFAAEVRTGRRSQILLLPQSRDPFALRCAQAVADTLRDYPEFPGRERWLDRVYLTSPAGEVRSLSQMWKGPGHRFAGNVATAMRVFGNQSVRSAIRLAFAERQEEATG